MQELKEKPILFNTEMVKAILDGRKTQTRRAIVTPKYKNKINNPYYTLDGGKYFIEDFAKYKVDDILWIRESARITRACNDTLKMDIQYLSDGTKKTIDIPKRYLDEYDFIRNDCFLAKLNQLHYDKEYVGVPNGCLKEMARIFIKVANVRVERLQDITLQDISKEGSPMDVNRADEIGEPDFCYEWWIDLWNSTAKDGYKWEDNPYVFVYEFERVDLCKS